MSGVELELGCCSMNASSDDLGKIVRSKPSVIGMGLIWRHFLGSERQDSLMCHVPCAAAGPTSVPKKQTVIQSLILPQSAVDGEGGKTSRLPIEILRPFPSRDICRVCVFCTNIFAPSSGRKQAVAILIDWRQKECSDWTERRRQ